MPSDDDFEDVHLEDSPIEKFAKLLEKNMLDGWSEMRCRAWATTSLGVATEIYERVYAMIKHSWKLPTMTYEKWLEEREIAKARYLHIFSTCMAKGQTATALGAVEKIVKLLGLDQPAQVNVTVNAPAAPNSQITNAAREQVSQLVQKMRELAMPDPRNDTMMNEALAREEKQELDRLGVGKKGVIEIEGRYLAEVKK